VSEPLVDGVTAAVVGVGDFTPHLELFCGQLGFEVAAEGVIGGDDAQRLWGPGVGDVEARLLTAAGSRSGRIHLLRVAAPAAPAEHPHTLDLGLAGIDVYTKDIEATHDQLVAAGFPWASRPATFEVPLGTTVVPVTEGFCLAPDGTDLVFVQPGNARNTWAWDADPARPYTEVTSVVCHVPDFAAELAFWGPDGLGMAVWYDVEFSSPGLEAMADLPAGTRMRLAFVSATDGSTARIEITHVADNPSGVDRRARQRPAHNLGHTGWSVRTRDLDRALDRARSAGARITCAPFTADTPLHGKARIAAVDTPNGIAVELFEPR
jgi:catechol 2,3-dioxygenase-like lactoylglutathione lyase family enzyme